MQHSGCYNIRSIEKVSLHYANLATGVVSDTTIKYLVGQMAELALLAGWPSCLPLNVLKNHEQVLLWQYLFISCVRASTSPTQSGKPAFLFFLRVSFFPNKRSWQFIEVGWSSLSHRYLLGRGAGGAVYAEIRGRRGEAHWSHLGFQFSEDGFS